MTAVVRYGQVALCGSCDARRSTLGKGEVPVRLTPAGPVDVLAWVGEARAAVADAEVVLAAAVSRARSQGRSWAEVGARLGVSRQAAQQWFTRAGGRGSG